VSRGRPWSFTRAEPVPQVKESDVPAILDEHLGKGKPVEKLKPDSIWADNTVIASR